MEKNMEHEMETREYGELRNLVQVIILGNNINSSVHYIYIHTPVIVT